MKRRLIITIVFLLLCGSLFSQNGKSIYQTGKAFGRTGKLIERKLVCDFLIDTKFIPFPRPTPLNISPFSTPTLQLTKRLRVSPLLSNHLDTLPSAKAITFFPKASEVIHAPAVSLPQESYLSSFHANTPLSNRPLSLLTKNTKLPNLSFQPLPQIPQPSRFRTKNPYEEFILNDNYENNDDCIEKPFPESNISPDAITIVAKEHGFLINNEPTDNPREHLVKVLSQKKTSTSAKIIFKNITNYKSVLDLDMIEQNTNLDIEHYVDTCYHNGDVLFQIPIRSKPLIDSSPKRTFLGKFKSFFKHLTEKDNNKGKLDEIRATKDLIESELKEIRFLENNIKIEYYDYSLEEETTA